MTKALFLTVLLSFAFSAQLSAQESPFPKGKVATVDNHTGTVWLSELSKADDVFDFNVAHATFAPGAKLDWHIHPGGQILMITEGTGYLLNQRGAFTIFGEDLKAFLGGGAHPYSFQYRFGGSGCSPTFSCPNSPHLSVPYDYPGTVTFVPMANVPRGGGFHVDEHGDPPHHGWDVYVGQ